MARGRISMQDPTARDFTLQGYVESILDIYSMNRYTLTFLLGRAWRGLDQQNAIDKLHPNRRAHVIHIINHILGGYLETHPLKKQIIKLILIECIQEESYKPAITRLKATYNTRRPI